MATKDEQFSDAEKAAMKARAKELRAKNKVDPETQVKNAIAEMSKNDQILASKIHELVTTHAPELKPKTWYGMPAYANALGKPVVFFQAASKFDSRLATLGFTEHGNLDDGVMWPTSWSLTKIDAKAQEQIVELIKKAITPRQPEQG